MAYNVRVPFSSISLARLSEPKHGDIVAVTDKRMVKRVAALPGEVIGSSELV